MESAKDERGMIEFQSSKSNMELYLRMTHEDGVIDDQRYRRLSRRVRRAKTNSELIRIARELAKDVFPLL